MDIFFDAVDEEIQCDVAVVGSGGAGIRAAIESFDNNADVILLNKGKFARSGSSCYKDWGIQMITKEEGANTYDNFLSEILEVGEGMASPKLAKILIEQTPARVKDMQAIGFKFKFSDKVISCFASIARDDAYAFNTQNIRNSFKNAVIKRNIRVIDDFCVIKIIKRESKDKNKITGLAGIDSEGNLVFIKAKSAILANGGCGEIYRYNYNPGLTGDGYNMALDVGASLINMEYLQFCWNYFNALTLLCGLPLINNKRQEFIASYIPKDITLEQVVKKRMTHGPFSSRIVSKYLEIAIHSEIKKGNGTRNDTVYLDLGDFNKNIDKILKSYPSLVDWYKQITSKKLINDNSMIEVYVCAHANNGGLFVNEEAMSEVEGLFACGEVMAGPHGADREGGNMMAATQVFGKIAGENAAKYSKSNSFEKIDKNKVLSDLNKTIKIDKQSSLTFSQIKKEIQDAVYSELVVCRDEKGLKWLINKLEDEFTEKLHSLNIENKREIKNYFTLKSIIDSAHTIANAALLRKESRGSHHRQDYPEKDDKNYRKIIRVKKTDGVNGFEFINPIA